MERARHNGRRRAAAPARPSKETGRPSRRTVLADRPEAGCSLNESFKESGPCASRRWPLVVLTAGPGNLGAEELPWSRVIRGQALLVSSFVFALLAVGARAGTAQPKPGTRCAPGTTAATISAKKVSPQGGRTLLKRLDRAYHRYRFHCHSGRLTRFPSPVPVPPVGTPPTLPEPPAPAGQLVDVGGYRLHLECVGTGLPTIVIEAGSLATRLGYRKVQYALSAENRVCTYDRPGTTAAVASASDPRPRVHTAGLGDLRSRAAHRPRERKRARPLPPRRQPLGGLPHLGLHCAAPSDVVGLVFIDAEAARNIRADSNPSSYLQSLERHSRRRSSQGR